MSTTIQSALQEPQEPQALQEPTAAAETHLGLTRRHHLLTHHPIRHQHLHLQEYSRRADQAALKEQTGQAGQGLLQTTEHLLQKQAGLAPQDQIPQTTEVAAVAAGQAQEAMAAAQELPIPFRPDRQGLLYPDQAEAGQAGQAVRKQAAAQTPESAELLQAEAEVAAITILYQMSQEGPEDLVR
jgi:hypothetical protein